MRLFRTLFWLITGLLSGAGAAAWLLQKEPPAAGSTAVSSPRTPLRTAGPPLVPVPPLDAAAAGSAPIAPLVTPNAELEQWKQRAKEVQAQLKEVEGALTGLRDELAAVQDWQARAPSLVRLGQSLARLPAHKAAAADAAIAAGCFPTVSLDCQDLSSIDGIGETYEQRLYAAGIGTFWELASVSDAELRQILRLSDWQLRSTDFADIRLQARQLAIDTNSAGLLWEGEAPDDFSRIKGIGKVYEQRLYEAGIRTYRALAAAKPEDLGTILGPQVFHPQISQWIAQAQALTAAEAVTPPPAGG